MREPLLMLGALFAALGVGLGAFGAHGLKARLGESLPTWETAVFYQLIHALAIVAVAVLIRSGAELPALRSIGWLFCAGIVLFSGSLYLLALGGPRWFGPITPLGGVAFMAGWLWLAVAAARSSAGS